MMPPLAGGLGRTRRVPGPRTSHRPPPVLAGAIPGATVRLPARRPLSPGTSRDSQARGGSARGAGRRRAPPVPAVPDASRVSPSRRSDHLGASPSLAPAPPRAPMAPPPSASGPLPRRPSPGPRLLFRPGRPPPRPGPRLPGPGMAGPLVGVRERRRGPRFPHRHVRWVAGLALSLLQLPRALLRPGALGPRVHPFTLAEPTPGHVLRVLVLRPRLLVGHTPSGGRGAVCVCFAGGPHGPPRGGVMQRPHERPRFHRRRGAPSPPSMGPGCLGHQIPADSLANSLVHLRGWHALMHLDKPRQLLQHMLGFGTPAPLGREHHGEVPQLASLAPGLGVLVPSGPVRVPTHGSLGVRQVSDSGVRPSGGVNHLDVQGHPLRGVEGRRRKLGVPCQVHEDVGRPPEVQHHARFR